MKTKNFALLFTLFLFAGSLGFLAATSPNNVALFWVIKNNVDRKPANQNWIKAKKGDLIYGGDYVRTQEKSFTLIKFNDASTIRLGPSAEVQIYGDNNPSSMNINHGDVDFTMTKRKVGQFEFVTSTSVASIRGTQGLLGVDANGTDFLTIIEGIVAFTNKISNSTDTVTSGYTCISYKDGSITMHKSTQEDLDRVNQLINEFLQQQHKLEMWFIGSDGKLHKITIETGQ